MQPYRKDTKEYDAVDPSVDKKLLTRFESVRYDGGKIALITGRTEKWLDQHLFPLIDDDADFLILGEYGDFRMWHKQRYWDDRAQEFERRYRELLKERIGAIAKAHGIRVKKDDRDYEPKSGELWSYTFPLATIWSSEFLSWGRPLRLCSRIMNVAMAAVTREV